MAVSELRMVTDAPGTVAPDGSVRVPVMVAEPAPWGKAGPARTASRASREITIKLVWRINVSSSFKRVKNVLRPTGRGSPSLPDVNFKRSRLPSIITKVQLSRRKRLPHNVMFSQPGTPAAGSMRREGVASLRNKSDVPTAYNTKRRPTSARRALVPSGKPAVVAVAAQSVETAGECLQVGHVGRGGETDRFVIRLPTGQIQQAVPLVVAVRAVVEPLR